MASPGQGDIARVRSSLEGSEICMYCLWKKSTGGEEDEVGREVVAYLLLSAGVLALVLTLL